MQEVDRSTQEEDLVDCWVDSECRDGQYYLKIQVEELDLLVWSFDVSFDVSFDILSRQNQEARPS